MGFHEVLWNSMRFYDVLVNRSVPTEANRGLTSYKRQLLFPMVWAAVAKRPAAPACIDDFGCLHNSKAAKAGN
jgi:hypothetical protein